MPKHGMEGDLGNSMGDDDGSLRRSLSELSELGSRYRCDVYLNETSFREWMSEDVLFGLTSFPKFLPSRYFYDSVGVELFDQITRLPEYYLTRAECSILKAVAPLLIRVVDADEIVEIGAGSTTKIRYLLDGYGRANRKVRYLPLDILQTPVGQDLLDLLVSYQWLSVHAIVGDFERHLSCLPPACGRRLVVFFGSTIGNLTPQTRADFLRQLSAVAGNDGFVLLGLDLVKDPEVIEAAYNDRSGITACFNRNILSVVNRVLQADFCLEAFDHLAFYNVGLSRVEMHLRSRCRQTVNIPSIGLRVWFAEGETIWTESSYKFTQASAHEMLRAAGMELLNWYEDAHGQFALVLARASR